MPAFDYTRARATSDRLIRRFGRQITLKTWSRTPANAQRPWLGAAATTGDPPEPNVTELELWGAFVPPAAVRIFGLAALGEAHKTMDLILASEQLIITYPADNDIKPYKVVDDGTSEWGVTAIQLLKPGPSQVLAFIGVRR